MFGYVMASYEELDQELRRRYTSVYCGICRSIGDNCSQLCRLSLSYDMTFLALTLSALYEPEEQKGANRCLPHPIRKRPWVRSSVMSYCADMNVALAYYSAKDKWLDDRRIDAHALELMLKPYWEQIAGRYPRQCEAITREISALSELEKAGCPNPDLAANCFGRLMEELFVYREDHWEIYLRRMAHALGRYIYLADAVTDLEKDRRRGSYNPFLAMGSQMDFEAMTRLLVLEMAECTRNYEMLPIVQDKSILDNILYSGIWITYRQKNRKKGRQLNNG